jgi:hypothetical protein
VDDIDYLFTYHSPTSEQVERYAAIRDGAKAYARVLVASCPAGPDLTAAIRKLRETVMTANAGVATGGGHFSAGPRVTTPLPGA